MKNIAHTAVLISSIAVFVALMFLAPKGFQLGDPSPILTSAEASETLALQ